MDEQCDDRTNHFSFDYSDVVAPFASFVSILLNGKRAFWNAVLPQKSPSSNVGRSNLSGLPPRLISMATHQMSRFAGTFGIIVLLLTVQVIGTEAWVGWFRSGRKRHGEGEYTSEREHATTNEGASGARTRTRTIQKHQFDIETPQVLTGGRGKEIFEKSIKLSSEHLCWREAYSGLESTCRDILSNPTKTARLALRLTNCFLETNGRPTLKKCTENWPISSCVDAMDDRNHVIYVSFFIDSAAICHHLQSQEFKIETELLVNELKLSAHYTEHKLGLMSQQLDNQHAAIVERSESILEIQKNLQMEHALLQESIQAGMGELQEAADEAQEQLDLVNKYQKSIAERQQELTESLQWEFSNLQHKSNHLSSLMTNLHGSVEDLTEKSMAGQEEAMRGLSELQRIQLEDIKESRMAVDAVVVEAQRHQDEFRIWQTELDSMHHRLLQGTTTMIKAQEMFVTKQASIFTTMEKLFYLHNSILLESRAVKTFMLYFALSIFVYIATTLKQTQNARLLLYFGLFLTMTFEIWLIRFRMEKLTVETLRLTWPPKQIVWLRYGYGVVALSYLLYTYLAHKDYEYLNYRMLKDIHVRFEDQCPLQKKLLAEYLVRCEVCKDIPQPHGQPPSPLGDHHPASYEDCESEFKGERVETPPPYPRTRLAMSRTKEAHRSKSEPKPVSPLAPRPRRRAAASAHTTGYSHTY